MGLNADNYKKMVKELTDNVFAAKNQVSEN